MAVDIDSKKGLAKSIYLLKIAKKYQENLCKLNGNENGYYKVKNIKNIIFSMKVNQYIENIQKFISNLLFRMGPVNNQ
ncbi:hypothetical protein [Campylobacter sp. US33a]|uniref:hypothetical protein n=1 Tax=Campylobacter sp. US33a TaxID=2498120 RepID=UPI0010682253|nr:hypothetical protein [Campylobacter sp. US33a]TEY03950.1 hypothetical protein ELQ16_01540 [Campylobacter sp. US33a]